MNISLVSDLSEEVRESKPFVGELTALIKTTLAELVCYARNDTKLDINLNDDGNNDTITASITLYDIIKDDIKLSYHVEIDYSEGKVDVRLEPDEIDVPVFRTGDEKQRILDFYDKFREVNLTLVSVLRNATEPVDYELIHPFTYEELP